ncbi:MAG: rhomboid family intramembrane serine protease, partial [Myxococcales bacterium]|nr:rhomboid family intramembrane serine protease [Myxococcales bacterium]
MDLWDKILRLLGTSRQQQRWKQHISEKRRQEDKQARQNRRRAISYKHKTCPSCGQPVDRTERTCPHCQAKLPSQAMHRTGRLLDTLTPRRGAVSTAIVVVIAIAFGTNAVLGNSAMSWGGLAGPGYGVNFGPLMDQGLEWWRLISYNFVHVGGLIHFGFNAYALSIVGPLVEEHFGASRLLVIFVATGIYAGLASHFWSPMGLSGGASGAVMGLLGAGVIAGHLSGTSSGRYMRDQLFRWFL